MDGVAKCGTLSDFGRDKAPTLAKYPIPVIYVLDMHLVLREAESTHQPKNGAEEQQQKDKWQVLPQLTLTDN